MRRAACASHDDPQPARPCTTRIRDQPVRRTVRRNDRELVRDVKVVEDARSRKERGEVRVGTHDDAYDRVCARVATAWDWRGWGVCIDICLRARNGEGGQEGAEARAQVGIGIRDEGDVPHFSARPTFRFTIQVGSAAGGGERGGSKGLDGVHGGGTPDDVEHHGGGDFERGASKGQPEDCTEVILVLGGITGFDSVVPRVMRAGGDFVDVYCA